MTLRNRQILSLTMLLLAIAVLSTLLWFTHTMSNPTVTIRIDSLEFQPSDASTPPKDPAWQTVTLPDNWYHSRRQSSSGWYRYTFDIEVAPDRLWGIYLPTLQYNAAVYLNDELLGTGGSLDEPVARNWNRPLYFSIPNGLIQPGRNTLHIRLKSTPPDKGLLAKVYLGPAEFLQPAYRLKYFVRYTLSQFIIIILVFTSILMFMLWRHRRHESINAWYALSLLVWTIHNLNLVIIEIPISLRYWDWLMYVSLLWFPVFSSCFVQRYIGEVNRKVEQASFVVAALCSVLLLLLPEAGFYWFGTRISNSLALGFGMYPLYRLVRYLQHNSMQEVHLLILTGFLLVIFGLHDWLAVNNLISREYGFFLHYSAPPGLLLFAFILLRQFVQAMNDSEELNRNLQFQVEKKHRELEQSYAALKQLDRQRTLVEERERLMREMHDGMGGQLVSTLALLEKDASDHNILREALQKALDDLRLMIDSMEDVDGDVLTILAMLRERLEPRLNQAGIQIDWQVTDLPSMSDLGPEKSLQLLRIFQEAITNVLKHAHADTVTFETRLTSDSSGQPGIHLECRDNGCGLPHPGEKPASSGRGLRNIQHRAEKLGGRAGIENHPHGGVRVWLWLPQE